MARCEAVARTCNECKETPASIYYSMRTSKKLARASNQILSTGKVVMIKKLEVVKSTACSKS